MHFMTVQNGDIVTLTYVVLDWYNVRSYH